MRKLFFLYCFAVALIISIGSLIVSKTNFIPFLVTLPVSAYFVWVGIESFRSRTMPKFPYMSTRKIMYAIIVLAILILISLVRIFT